MARAIDKDYLLKHKRKVRFFGIGPDDESWGYAVPAEIIENAPTITPPNEWVSVEERLPEKKQDVLMFFKSGNMAVGWWHDLDEHITFWCAYTDDGFYTDCDDIPTHWMSLPEPPDRRPPEGDR